VCGGERFLQNYGFKQVCTELDEICNALDEIKVDLLCWFNFFFVDLLVDLHHRCFCAAIFGVFAAIIQE
jgi:hypothetical protein